MAVEAQGPSLDVLVVAGVLLVPLPFLLQREGLSDAQGLSDVRVHHGVGKELEALLADRVEGDAVSLGEDGVRAYGNRGKTPA